MKTSPTEKQLKFLSWEFGAFFHFGIRTFNHGHRDWDGRGMPAETAIEQNVCLSEWNDTTERPLSIVFMPAFLSVSAIRLWSFVEYRLALTGLIYASSGPGRVSRRFASSSR